jgi:5-(carboxyamino)imidazole ribonucleotide mutase
MDYKVLVVMGSDSDFPVMENCIRQLVEFGIPYDARICSAHRTPELAIRLARGATAAGYGVIIAAAGLAAHLPGVMAACTTLPVIGVPIKSGALDGVDALYSIVQMPNGIPVATVAIDGAANAAILAAQILALGDSQLAARLSQFKEKISDSVTVRQSRLEEKLRAIQ